jgi:hypothetical protein
VILSTSYLNHYNVFLGLKWQTKNNIDPILYVNGRVVVKANPIVDVTP